MPGDVDVNDRAALMLEDEPDEQDPRDRGWNREEVLAASASR